MQYILQLPSDQSFELVEGSRCSLLPSECVCSVLDVGVRSVSLAGPASDSRGEASGRGVCSLPFPLPPRLPVLSPPCLTALLRALRFRWLSRLSRRSWPASTQRLRLSLRGESAVLRCPFFSRRASSGHAAADRSCSSSSTNRSYSYSSTNRSCSYSSTSRGATSVAAVLGTNEVRSAPCGPVVGGSLPLRAHSTCDDERGHRAAARRTRVCGVSAESRGQRRGVSCCP